MHRFTAFLLAALLLAGLCVPAMAAAESADARLARVTQAVKDTLDLDTEQYTDFHGDVYEQELGTVWSLHWSGNGASLNIEALEDGAIVNYWRSDGGEDVYSYYGYGLPALPKLDADAAKAAANAFLACVLDEKAERVELGEPASATRLNSTSCNFSGAILLNGLPSPLNYSVTVRGSDNTVTSFYRDALANLFLGNIPSAAPAVTKDAAAQTLKDTLKLELIYVVSEGDETQAVLRYVPKDETVQYVDAQTGKLVTPDGDMILYAGASNATAEEAAADASVARGLTQAELSGIEKLEGVLDSAELDNRIRAESAYQLDSYTLSTANYRLVKEKDAESVLCAIRYTSAGAKDGYTSSRTFTVDARTGEVKSLYSGSRWDKDAKSAVALAAAQSTAESFLRRFTAHAGEFALYDTADNTADGAPFYGFTFARKVNGYFFPANACTIQIDRMTGAVAGVSYTYDDAVKFDSTDSIVSENAALDAWMATYDVTLAYRSMPKELSKAVAAEARLIGLGYKSFRTLLLSYGLNREGYFPGVDAKTGKPVEIRQTANEIAYTDVASHWAAKEIGTLAQYGIGYGSETFRPNKQLTQWELVALLVSTRGLRLDLDNTSEDEKNSAYETAYRMGSLTRGERSDDTAMDRGQVVKMLLCSAGYGPVAKLSGIFTCAYRDRASIPAADLGYAALAQGFGIVRNDRYEARKPATRAEAAVMLCRLMERAA